MFYYLVLTIQVQEQALFCFFPNVPKRRNQEGGKTPYQNGVFLFLLTKQFDKIIVRYLFCKNTQVYSDKDQVESMTMNKEFNLTPS